MFAGQHWWWAGCLQRSGSCTRQESAVTDLSSQAGFLPRRSVVQPQHGTHILAAISKLGQSSSSADAAPYTASMQPPYHTSFSEYHVLFEPQLAQIPGVDPRRAAHPPKPISYMASTRPHATLHMSRAQEPRQRRERVARAELCMRPKMQSAVSESRATPTSVASRALPMSEAWLH